VRRARARAGGTLRSPRRKGDQSGRELGKTDEEIIELKIAGACT
jgi:hypothetical protein